VAVHRTFSGCFFFKIKDKDKPLKHSKSHQNLNNKKRLEKIFGEKVDHRGVQFQDQPPNVKTKTLMKFFGEDPGVGSNGFEVERSEIDHYNKSKHMSHERINFSNMDDEDEDESVGSGRLGFTSNIKKRKRIKSLGLPPLRRAKSLQFSKMKIETKKPEEESQFDSDIKKFNLRKELKGLRESFDKELALLESDFSDRIKEIRRKYHNQVEEIILFSCTNEKNTVSLDFHNSELESLKLVYEGKISLLERQINKNKRKKHSYIK